MEYQNEYYYGWRAVPQFGAWDHKGGVSTDYSVVFSQARAHRKRYKSGQSFGRELELLTKTQDGVPVMKKKKLLTYFSCCVGG